MMHLDEDVAADGMRLTLCVSVCKYVSFWFASCLQFVLGGGVCICEPLHTQYICHSALVFCKTLLNEV